MNSKEKLKSCLDSHHSLTLLGKSIGIHQMLYILCRCDKNKSVKHLYHEHFIFYIEVLKYFNELLISRKNVQKAVTKIIK